MDIKKLQDGSSLAVALDGRLDTKTAPDLEAALDGLAGITELELDMAGVPYVSSAGLRVLLTAQKTMNRQGAMTLVHVCEDVMDVFDMTGFSGVLTIAS